MKRKTDIEIEERKASNNSEREELDLALDKPAEPGKKNGYLAYRYGLISFGLLAVIGLLIWRFTGSDTSTLEDPDPSFPEESQIQRFLFEEQHLELSDDFLALITSEEQILPLDWYAIRDLEQILSWTIGLRYLKAKDSLSIIWRTPILGDKQLDDLKEIVALKVQTISLDTTLYAFLYDRADRERFFGWEGRPLEARFLSSPVTYGRISSRYNLTRLNPVLKRVKPHRGTDFAAPKGSPLLAIADGEVLYVGETEANGRFVRLRHDSVYRSTYLHLDSFTPGLEVGEKVKQGQEIGKVGDSGSATGPHVCLRFYVGDFQADYVKLFPYLPRPEPMKGVGFTQFEKYRDSLIAVYHW